jgi:hypothetical protein
MMVMNQAAVAISKGISVEQCAAVKSELVKNMLFLQCNSPIFARTSGYFQNSEYLLLKLQSLGPHHS